MDKKEGILSKIKKIKHIEIMVAVGAVIIMLIVYFAGFGGSSKAPESTDLQTAYSDYCGKMQAEVSDYVSKIKGAGKTTAVINWESGVELLLASTESNSTSSSTSSPLIVSGTNGSKPIVIKEIYPKAVGVVVVCEGGSDASVKFNIVLSVSTLLNISVDKVIVLPMNKKK